MLLGFALGSLGDALGPLYVTHALFLRMQGRVTSVEGAKGVAVMLFVCENVVESLRSLASAAGIVLRTLRPESGPKSSEMHGMCLIPLPVDVLPGKVDVQTELEVVTKVVRDCCPSSPAAILFNLSSLIGYHIADMFGCPRAIVSPTFPATFPSNAAVDELLTTLSPLPRGVTREDVAHWMAPLFSKHYEEWRRKHGLATGKLADCSIGPLCYGFSSLVHGIPSSWPHRVVACGKLQWNCVCMFAFAVAFGHYMLQVRGYPSQRLLCQQSCLDSLTLPARLSF
jgi:hypothetical protein